LVKVLGLEAYAVETAPQAYDIASVAFPYKENPGTPGPKTRPCLVLSVSVHVETRTSNPYATMQVAYGTSATQKGFPLDIFRVHNFEALQRSGLSKDTYFCLDRIQTLMWCEEFFPIMESFGTPIMGRLPYDYIIRLKQQKEIRDEFVRQGVDWKDIEL